MSDAPRYDLVRAAAVALQLIETLCVEYVKPGCLREKQCHRATDLLRNALAATGSTDQQVSRAKMGQPTEETGP